MFLTGACMFFRALISIGLVVFAATWSPAHAQSTPTCAAVDEVVQRARTVARQARDAAGRARDAERRAEAASARAERGAPGTRNVQSFDQHYRGEWADGDANGVGELLYMTDRMGEYYVGEFRYGAWEGYGVYHGYDDDSGALLSRYEGQFHAGGPEGFGREVGARRDRPDRYVMEGTYVRGQLHGLAVMNFEDGYVYEGEMADGDQSGLGVFRGPDTRQAGRFSTGHFVERCVD